MRCLSYAEALRQKPAFGQFSLFSMFFGAGNLIFPPHLGAQADGADGGPGKNASDNIPQNDRLFQASKQYIFRRYAFYVIHRYRIQGVR